MGEVRDFASEYPDWGILSREDFRKKMQSLAWTPEDIFADRNLCLEVYSAEVQNTLTTFVTWGQGSGFVFILPSTGQNKRALTETLGSLQFTGDHCHWKTPASP